MKYQFAQLIDLEQMQLLLDSFCQTVGIASAIIDLQGKVLVSARWQRICTDFHRVNEESFERCIESDTVIANLMKEGERYTMYTCRNGLTDAASPVVIEDKHVANVFVGQFLIEQPDREFFRRQAGEYGFNEADYLKALDEVPVVAKEKLPAILDFLTTFARMIGKMGLDSMRQREVEEALREEKERAQKYLDVAGVMLVAINADQKVTLINKKGCEILGYEEKEIIGKNWFENFVPLSFKKGIIEAFNRLMAGDIKPVEYYENPVLTKSGEERITAWHNTILNDEEGRIIGTLSSGEDITERKLAEEALRESEERFRLAFENANIGMCLVDLDGNLKMVNKQMCNMFGYSRDELEGMTVNDIAYPEDKNISPSFIKQALSGEVEHSQFEKRYFNKQGNIVCGQVSSSLVRDSQGNPLYFISHIQNITEHKLSEEAIRESEERFRLMAELSPFPVSIISLEGRYLYINRKFKEVFGYTLDDMPTGRDWFHLAYPDPEYRKEAIATWKNDLRESFKGIERPRMFRVRCKDGSDRDIVIKSVTLEDGKQFLIYDDITERKKAEEALRKSEEKLRFIVEQSTNLFYSHTPDHVLTYFSPQIKNILGYEPEEVMIRWTELVTDNPVNKKGFVLTQKAIDTGKRQPPYELELRAKEGRKVWVEIHETPVVQNGKTITIVGAATDITERKLAEEALRESETKYRELVQSANSIILRMDTGGKVTFFNVFAQKFFGFSEDEILGRNVVGTIVPETDTSGRDLAAMIRDIAEHPERYSSNENENMRKNGERVLISWTNKAVLDEEGKIKEILCIGNDITARRQLEEERNRTAKLESVGILAGGIAHDFNNILTAILGNISLAKMIGVEGPVLDSLTDAEKACGRAKDLTQQLLTFAKGGVPVKKVASIAEILKESAGFALRGSDVTCEFSIADNLWQVEVDEGQISQVINNLVINADQAMLGGGTIKIQAGNVRVKASQIPYLEPGRYVKITVADQGEGIPEENITRIFDPYFTTKPTGSGLGLATSYSIVKRHGGQISVESRLKKGTTFHVYLPASSKKVYGEMAEQVSISAGSGRILVMDDNQPVREVLFKMLIRLGYEPEATKDGGEALEAYKKAFESTRPFAAVIVDLTIPGGMGGKEVIKKLLEIDPKVKAIVSSGYSSDPLMSDFSIY